MSFSLAIEDGDLQLKGSAIGIVYGVDKLNQDISVWLRERFQSDRFHLKYGSILDSYIGSVITDSTSAEVRSEIMRVLQNYQEAQAQIIRKEPSRLSADEILLSVDDIQVRVEYDSVLVNIRFSTAKGTPSNVSVDVGLS
jgi:phage baseplate assembly protein W